MNFVTSISLVVLGAMFLALLGWGSIRAAWRNCEGRRGVFAALAILAAICSIVAQKPSPDTPTITVDALLRDVGCYATNNVFHAAVTNAPNYAGVDFSDCDLMVYARERASSDAASWFELTPRKKFSQQPADYAIENATNFNYMVYLNYVPPSPVHTNGVFELYGFVIGNEAQGEPDQLAAGFINSRAVPLPFDAEVEYLESTGKEWIVTGINASQITRYVTDTHMLAVGAEGMNMIPYVFIGIHNTGYFYGYVGRSSPSTVRNDNNRHVFELVNSGTDADGFYIDGVLAKPRGTGDVTSCPFWLFACYQVSVVNYHLKQKKYSAQIYIGETLVRDYIPVRKGNVGYMYDQVSGQLFGNAGTGAFIVGPDK